MTADQLKQSILQANEARARLLGCLSAFEQRLLEGPRNCWLLTEHGQRLMLLWSGYPVQWVRAHGTFFYAVDNLTGHGTVQLGRTAKIPPGLYRVIFAGADDGVPR